MSVFAEALDDIYEDDEFALDALYTPAGGSPVGVRVIRSQPTTEVRLGGGLGGMSRPANTMTVRKSEVAQPAENATLTLTVGGERFKVQGSNLKDAGFEWILDLASL